MASSCENFARRAQRVNISRCSSISFSAAFWPSSFSWPNLYNEETNLKTYLLGIASVFIAWKTPAI